MRILRHSMFGLSLGAALPAMAAPALLQMSPADWRPAVAPPTLVVFAQADCRVHCTLAADVPNATDIKATLLLDGGALGAPVAQGIPFQVSEADRDGLASGYFEFDLTQAKQTAVYRLVVTQANSDKVVATQRLMAIPPRSLAVVLKRMTRQPGHQLVVFGELPGFRDYLDANGIAYEDEGDNPPARGDAGMTLVGQVSDETQLPALVAGANLLAVMDAPAAVAAVRTVARDGRVKTLLQPPASPDWGRSATFHWLLTEHLLLTHPSRHDD